MLALIIIGHLSYICISAVSLVISTNENPMILLIWRVYKRNNVRKWTIWWLFFFVLSNFLWNNGFYSFKSYVILQRSEYSFGVKVGNFSWKYLFLDKISEIITALPLNILINLRQIIEIGWRKKNRPSLSSFKAMRSKIIQFDVIYTDFSKAFDKVDQLMTKPFY